MPTIAENLQTLINIKADIKAALESQSKEPTNAMGTYAGLIDGLENPDQVEYCVTVDGENKAYAQLYGEQKVELTATANDVRIGTSVISSEGYMEGEKEIPAYYSSYGKKSISAGGVAVIPYQAGYKNLMVSIAPYNSSVSASTAIKYVSVENSMYAVDSTTKLSDISVDTENEQINLGITVDVMSILRYIVVREEV